MFSLLSHIQVLNKKLLIKVNDKCIDAKHCNKKEEMF